jgi:hypothetical protein
VNPRAADLRMLASVRVTVARFPGRFVGRMVVTFGGGARDAMLLLLLVASLMRRATLVVSCLLQHRNGAFRVVAGRWSGAYNERARPVAGGVYALGRISVGTGQA